jgi:hypothetical protein
MKSTNAEWSAKDMIVIVASNLSFFSLVKYKEGATVRNYAKSIKLFCDMADIPIPWKKTTRGLSRGKNMPMGLLQ